MKSLRIMAVAVGLSALAACGGGGEDAGNADANIALESENLDAGLNATDLNAGTDANLGTGTDINAVDANTTVGNDTTNATKVANTTNNAG